MWLFTIKQHNKFQLENAFKYPKTLSKLPWPRTQWRQKRLLPFARFPPPRHPFPRAPMQTRKTDMLSGKCKLQTYQNILLVSASSGIHEPEAFFLWFVYKLKFHVIAALAFNVNKIYWGPVPFYQPREGVSHPKPREMDQSRVLGSEWELGKVSGEGRQKSLAKPHCLPGCSARRNPSYPWPLSIQSLRQIEDA